MTSSLVVCQTVNLSTRVVLRHCYAAHDCKRHCYATRLWPRHPPSRFLPVQKPGFYAGLGPHSLGPHRDTSTTTTGRINRTVQNMIDF